MVVGFCECGDERSGSSATELGRIREKGISRRIATKT
jgi:hypothetical protein